MSRAHQRKHRVSGTPVSVPRATTCRSIAISHPAHPSPPVNAPHTVHVLAGVSNTRQMCRVPGHAGRWAVAEPSRYHTASIIPAGPYDKVCNSAEKLGILPTNANMAKTTHIHIQSTTQAPGQRHTGQRPACNHMSIHRDLAPRASLAVGQCPAHRPHPRRRVEHPSDVPGAEARRQVGHLRTKLVLERQSYRQALTEKTAFP